MNKSKVLAILAAATMIFTFQTASASPYSVLGGSWNDVFKRVFANAPVKTNSGTSYMGELNDYGNYQGEGAQMLDDGTTYWGEYRNGHFDGTYAIYIIGNPDKYQVKNCSNCAFYVGDFVNGIKQGLGTCYDVNGKLIYYGEFENDKPVGAYPTTNPDLVDPYTWDNLDNGDGTYYIGELKYGAKHGQGIMVVNYGEYAAWFGTFDEGDPVGNGMWFKADGSFFSGSYDDVDLTPASAGGTVVNDAVMKAFDLAISHPSLTDSNGKYIGNMRNGSAYGLGMYKFNNNEYVFGDFTDTRRDGMCIYIITNPDYHFTDSPDSKYFVGYYSNNVKEGTGTMYDAEGTLLYYGNFSNGSPTEEYPSSGYGKYRFERIDFSGGDIYIGETMDGDPHGRGIYIYGNPDLGVWYGRYSDGKVLGEGVLLGYDGSITNGEFDEDGHFHESSSVAPVSSQPVYESLYKNSLYDSMIKKMFATVSKSFSSGDKYKGMLNDGYMTGLGAYRWSTGSMYWGYQYQGSSEDYGIYMARDGYEISNCPDGSFYVGEYYDDKRHGTGTIYDENGTLLYYGNFRDGVPTETYPSTDSYLQEFRFEIIDCGSYVFFGETLNGERHGYGFIIFKNNGDAWYGHWSDNRRSGKGVYIFADGSAQYGEWDGDQYTRLPDPTGGSYI